MRIRLGLTIIVMAAAGCGDTFSSGGEGGAGAAAGTGGTAGSGGDAGSGGSTGSENCSNGIDDDGDQLVDCDDSDCQAQFTCVPQPPAGWNGVGWLYPNALTSCPDGMVSRDLFLETDLIEPSPQCDCSCGSVQGVDCVSSVVCAANATCSTADVPTDIGTSCTALALPGVSQDEVYCEPSMPFPKGGECAASLAPIPDFDWAPSQRSCLSSSAGLCSDGQMCAPRPASGAAGPCIARDGDHSCPPAYVERSLFRPGTFDDQRACSECCCSSPQGVGCGTTGNVSYWSVPSCTGGADQTLSFGDCTLIDTWSNTASAELHSASATGGDCEPCGGDATGHVLPTGWVTVCCLSP